MVLRGFHPQTDVKGKDAAVQLFSLKSISTPQVNWWGEYSNIIMVVKKF